MKRYFIITVDTEGDNLWGVNAGEGLISTECAKFIPRFQELCESYSFKPVYLTNYEMAKSYDFINYIRPKVESNKCEIGIHVHAWNTPPIYQLDGRYNGNPYLIEYPEDVMYAKFKETYDLIERSFGVKPISHRAGRWVMNDRYFKMLEDFGILIDCSYTPLISWGNVPGITIPGGSDYRNVNRHAHYVGDVLEVPMTTARLRYCSRGSVKKKLLSLRTGQISWLRPAIANTFEQKLLIKKIEHNKNINFVDLMIHSSELMPNGSPYFKTPESIELLYHRLSSVFSYVSHKGYIGVSLKEYLSITKDI